MPDTEDLNDVMDGSDETEDGGLIHDQCDREEDERPDGYDGDSEYTSVRIKCMSNE